jgi:anti-anti-sigma factor
VTAGSPIDIAWHSTERGDVIAIGGELDLTNSQRLADALSAASATTVILDLGGLDFIDSAGMRTIDQMRRLLASAGRTLLIVAPTESRAAWTFRVAGFDHGFVQESVDAALLKTNGGS